MPLLEVVYEERIRKVYGLEAGSIAEEERRWAVGDEADCDEPVHVGIVDGELVSLRELPPG